MKHYTVFYKRDNKPFKKRAFTSHEEAIEYASTLRARPDVDEGSVIVARSGPHPNAPLMQASRTEKRRNPAQRGSQYSKELVFAEDEWTIPEGYVDGDADKHGPTEYIPVPMRKSPQLKLEARFSDTVCLWQ